MRKIVGVEAGPQRKDREIEDITRASNRMTLDFQVVQSQANERLNAFEILRAMLAHQDQSLEEWQDRTEASDPKSKELEIELEESKNKLRGAGWKFSREHGKWSHLSSRQCI